MCWKTNLRLRRWLPRWHTHRTSSPNRKPTSGRHPEQPLADAEEGESLAGWLAERPLGEEDEARLATVISIPAVDAEVLPEDDDWTQPPLEELARLAKEAPLATPEPDAEIIEPAALRRMW